jgi:hypothetical protein
MDRPELADFLRKRRQALQPEDVGLFRWPRRRTSGLRREEVAELCGIASPVPCSATRLSSPGWRAARSADGLPTPRRGLSTLRRTTRLTAVSTPRS